MDDLDNTADTLAGKSLYQLEGISNQFYNSQVRMQSQQQLVEDLKMLEQDLGRKMRQIHSETNMYIAKQIRLQQMESFQKSILRYYKLLVKIRKGKLNRRLKKSIAESEENVEKIQARHQKNLQRTSNFLHRFEQYQNQQEELANQFNMKYQPQISQQYGEVRSNFKKKQNKLASSVSNKSIVKSRKQSLSKILKAPKQQNLQDSPYGLINIGPKKNKIVSPYSGLPILKKEEKTKEAKLKISSISKYERKQKNNIELSSVSAMSSKKGSSGKESKSNKNTLRVILYDRTTKTRVPKQKSVPKKK